METAEDAPSRVWIHGVRAGAPPILFNAAAANEGSGVQVGRSMSIAQRIRGWALPQRQFVRNIISALWFVC